MTRWEWLVNNARLDIREFSIDRWEHFSAQNRRFPFYVMSYIKEGNAGAIVDGNHYNTPVGTLLLVPANARHSHFIPEGEGPTTFLWWHFNITVSGLDLMKLIDFPIVLQIRDSMTFESMFYAYMGLKGKAPTLPGLIYKRAKEFEIMALLFENILNATETTSNRLEEVPEVFFEMMKDIVENPECNASLQELAGKYYLNATYISNRFKKLYGISPIRLHNQVVINYAKDILSENESCSIHELALRLGFGDVSTFSHFFSSRVGCPPTDYRKQFFS